MLLRVTLIVIVTPSKLRIAVKKTVAKKMLLRIQVLIMTFRQYAIKTPMVHSRSIINQCTRHLLHLIMYIMNSSIV